jgi:hypothetical protein
MYPIQFKSLAYFKILRRNLQEGTEEDHEKYQDSLPPVRYLE